MFGFGKRLDRDDIIKSVATELGIIKCMDCKQLYFKEDLNWKDWNAYCDKCYGKRYDKKKLNVVVG